MNELCRAMATVGLAFAPKLVAMLEEHCSHQTERRGCGYTQATRFLSHYVNLPRDAAFARDLGIFSDWDVDPIERLAERLISADWSPGWRRLWLAPAAVRQRLACKESETLLHLHEHLQTLEQAELRFESMLLLGIITDILDGSEQALPQLLPMAEKPQIGSCSQAEEFFLEIAHGKIRRGGSANLVCDNAGQPLLIEKMNLGESHSAILLAPAKVNDVAIPAGGLFALRHAESAASAPRCESGFLLSINDIAAARFLRLTTLTVEPQIRRRAFSSQVDSQVRSNMVSPLSTTLDDLRDRAAHLKKSTA